MKGKNKKVGFRKIKLQNILSKKVFLKVFKNLKDK